jgi:hypothetical protein
MTWSRGPFVAALVPALQASLGDTVYVHPKPPTTLNPPAVIIGRPLEVVHSTAGFGVDTISIPVHCLGPLDGDDMVESLTAGVRGALADPSLGGAVQSVTGQADRNWHNLNVAGADLLQADAILTVQM